MVKEYIAKGLRYFLFLAICLVTSLAASIVGVVIARFSFTKDSVGESVIMGIIMLITMLIGMFILSRGFAYKEGKFDVKSVIIPIVIAFVIHLAVAAILQFAIYTSGPAFCVGKIIAIIDGNASGRLAAGYIFPFVPVFDILYAAAAFAGEKAGAKKRIAEREKLTGKRS